MKFLNWVKQEYIIGSVMINQLIMLNFFMWVAA